MALFINPIAIPIQNCAKKPLATNLWPRVPYNEPNSTIFQVGYRQHARRNARSQSSRRLAAVNISVGLKLVFRMDTDQPII